MSDKLSGIKDKLAALGVSTNTPGLRGKERLEELKNRLEDALMAGDGDEAEGALRTKSRGATYAVDEVRSIAKVVEGLTSAQIRENLNMLGQNTNTPGLTGDQRREELMRRLIQAVEEANMADTFVQELAVRIEEGNAAEPVNSKPPTLDATATVSEAKQHIGAVDHNSSDNSTKNSSSDIFDLYRNHPLALEVYRLADQRKRMVEMRTQTGPHQESGLKELDNKLLQVLAEIDFLQTNKSKDKFRKESSVLINDGELMSVGKLLSLLSQQRVELQEKMVERKDKIAEAESNHPAYGIAVEQELRTRLAQEIQQMESTQLVQTSRGIGGADAIESGERKKASTKASPLTSVSTTERVAAAIAEATAESKAQVTVREITAARSVHREPLTVEAPTVRRQAPVLAPRPPSSPEAKRTREPVRHEGAKEDRREEVHENQGTEDKHGIRGDEKNEKEDDSSSDEDLENLPPLLPQPIPPPTTEPKGPEHKSAPTEPVRPTQGKDQVHTEVDDAARDTNGNDADFLGELTIADSKRGGREYAPPSTYSELPTDSSFRTDFSPTGEMSGVAGANKSWKPQKPTLLDKALRNSASVSGGIRPKSGNKGRPRDKTTQDDDHLDMDRNDMYGSSEDEEQEDGEAGHMGNAAMGIAEVRRIKELRAEARQHDLNGQLDEAEAIYLQALDIDPTDIRTLDKYAIFLHRRRGELPRAAAFFRRAIQECVPSLLSSVREERMTSVHSPRPIPVHTAGALRSKVVTQVLLHYGRFLQRAQGDIDLAEDVFRKAIAVSPEDAEALGSLGRFLASDPLDPHEPLPPDDSEEMKRMREAEECFIRALRIDPDNITHLLWYAKLLKNMRKITQADILYSAAIKKCTASVPGSRGARLEPTALCNYASFLLKYRRDGERAEEIFKDGLERFPKHKGLNRNYKHFSKVAAKKRARAPPKVPADIAQQLMIVDEVKQHNEVGNMNTKADIEKAQEKEVSYTSAEEVLAVKANGNAEIKEYRVEDHGDVEKPQSQEDNGVEAEDCGYEDGSVVSALTCQWDALEKEKVLRSPGVDGNKMRKTSAVSVELDGTLRVVEMACGGFTECMEGESETTLIDLSDSTISMTVSAKPGAWRWVQDLSCRDSQRRVYGTITGGGAPIESSMGDGSDSATAVNLRSSMIVSVHQRSNSNPSSAVMLGFVVLSMTAIMASSEVEENTFIVERPFQSEKFSFDRETSTERKIKVAGKLSVKFRIDILYS